MDEIPCNHDFLDTNTTLVVDANATTRLTWCISCGRKRKLLPLNEVSRTAALAGRDHMLFGGGSRGNN